MQELFFPADVPLHARAEFLNNYNRLTFSTGKLFLFAADHKLEHLDEDFHGEHISPEAHDPRHLFSIASKAPIGGFATHLGLISRYAREYPSIPYVIKLNGKTNLLKDGDPFSQQLWTVDDVVTFKESSGLSICAVGLTVYLGSNYEDKMLEQAAQMVFQAHQQGLIAILWMYPRSGRIKDTGDSTLLAGAVGVAASLGADFAKIHPPTLKPGQTMEHELRFIIEAAGTTKVICAGGERHSQELVLNALKEQVSAGCAGAAIGRNLYQHSQQEALALAQKISKLIYSN